MTAKFIHLKFVALLRRANFCHVMSKCCENMSGTEEKVYIFILYFALWVCDVHAKNLLDVKWILNICFVVVAHVIFMNKRIEHYFLVAFKHKSSNLFIGDGNYLACGLANKTVLIFNSDLTNTHHVFGGKFVNYISKE